ncbi:hypothetical protein V6N13_110492 [Hibiscus sabdariffa]
MEKTVKWHESNSKVEVNHTTRSAASVVVILTTNPNPGGSNEDLGTKYNMENEGIFRRRMSQTEPFDQNFRDVLNEWHKTIVDSNAGFRQAYEVGLAFCHLKPSVLHSNLSHHRSSVLLPPLLFVVAKSLSLWCVPPPPASPSRCPCCLEPSPPWGSVNLSEQGMRPLC